MADWKDLPDTLDPSMRQLVTELRRLKDRSRLSLAALALRTAYSKSSWERYLNGAKLPPRQAVEALCGIAGAPPARLLALWELAETAWSGRGSSSAPADTRPSVDTRRREGTRHREDTQHPADVRRREDARHREDTRHRESPPPSPGPHLAAVPQPQESAAPPPAPATPAAPAPATSATPTAPAPTAPAPVTSAPAAPAPRPLPIRPGWWPLPRRAVAPLVCLVVAAAGAGVTLAVHGGSPHRAPADAAAQDVTSATRGLTTKCQGGRCTGHDPKAMGCGGDAWTAAKTRVGLAYVEVRYSNACRAAWGRIQWGSVGDRVQIAAGDGRPQRGRIHYDADAYTPMVGALTPRQVRACVTLTSGRHGCTAHGGDRHLEEPPEWPGPTASTGASGPASTPASTPASAPASTPARHR
jgi:transcriptional regulator with XRE-family HTH domain